MIESEGASCECSMARAVFPTLGRQVRSAAMTDAQKRIGSLSNASSESQARAGSRSAAWLSRSSREEATHAERRVVFPLPAEAKRDMYSGKDGRPTTDSDIGYRASGVPGTPRGLELAQRQYGVKTWAQLVQPAWRLASEGFIVSYGFSQSLKLNQDRLSKFPDSKRIFLRNGRGYEPGEVFRQSELAHTLKRLMNSGARDFYEGETAHFIAADMRAVDAIIRNRLTSDVVLVRQVAEYIVGGGGKRLRPALVILSAGAFRYTGKHHYQLAAIIEFIHTATLLHDDVVDASQMRRGNATANALFGNAASVLVGDFVYSRAFEMMVEVESLRVMQVLAEATNVIAEGEVLQLMNCHNAGIDEHAYLRVIRYKTAKLFEAAAQIGALLGGASPEREQALARYGMHLGTSFQLIDDVLDYSGDLTTIFGWYCAAGMFLARTRKRILSPSP